MLGIRAEFWAGLVVGWVIGTILVYIVYLYLAAIGPAPRCSICQRFTADDGTCNGYHVSPLALADGVAALTRGDR